jgi:hypothetical protein
MEGEAIVADDHGMPGIGPAGEADDDVEVLGEQIDDLALALVAPLKAADTGITQR